MNQEAWDVTRRTGFVTFFSRTRNALWTKGETSGNRLQVSKVWIDCDEDTILVEGDLPRRRRRLPHRDAHLLPRTARTDDRRKRCGHEIASRHPQGLAAGRHGRAVRPRRLQRLRQLALLFPDHRRSRDRVHADPRPGDGALRRRRRPRRRADRPGLDRRALGAAVRRSSPENAPVSASPTWSTPSRASARCAGCSPRPKTRRFRSRRISRARPSPPSWCASPSSTSSAGVNVRSSSRGAPPRSSRRCSPTPSSRPPRPDRRCAPTGCASSTP